MEIAQEAENLARGSPLGRRACSLLALTTEAIEAIADLAATKSVVVAVEGAGRAPSTITDPERLRRVLSHLILRALIGSADGGRIDVTVESLDAVNQIVVRPSQGPPETGLHDLGGAARLLYALGAVLVAEPSDRAPAALCIVLPAETDPTAARPS